MSDIASYKEAVLADVPSIYLPLDATDGLTDQSGNGRNGTGVGGVTVGGVLGPGDALTATDFDGVDDWITTTYAPDALGSTRTYELWINRDTGTTVDALFAGANGQLKCQLQTNGDFKFFPSTTEITWIAAVNGITTGAWFHVMVVYNDATLTGNLLVNGVSKGAQAASVGFVDATETLIVGSRGSGAQAFDGKLAHLAIYPGDLSARALDHWSWGISTSASRIPNFGLPSTTNFPSNQNLPTGETLGDTP